MKIGKGNGKTFNILRYGPSKYAILILIGLGFSVFMMAISKSLNTYVCTYV